MLGRVLGTGGARSDLFCRRDDDWIDGRRGPYQRRDLLQPVGDSARGEVWQTFDNKISTHAAIALRRQITRPTAQAVGYTFSISRSRSSFGESSIAR